MSDFAKISELVTQGQQLLDSIKGGAIRIMQQEHVAGLAALATKGQGAIAKLTVDYANVLKPTTEQIPNIAITKNQVLEQSTSNIPNSLIVNSSVSVSKFATVSHVPSARDAGILTLLSEIETGVKKDFPDFDIRKSAHYYQTFNVFRISWDFGSGDPSWLFLPGVNNGNGAIPFSSVMTGAALVKLESGSMGYHALATGAVLGEWRFTKEILTGNYFGKYVNCHPYAASKQGSMLVALPVVATGYLDHPSKLLALPENS